MSRSAEGFSLLEVVIATAILVSSSMVLLRLLSVGEQHQSRGERRAMAQIVAQSILDHLLVDEALRQSMDEQPAPGYLDWTYTVEVDKAETPNSPIDLSIDRLRIRVYATKERGERPGLSEAARRPDFELIRWMRRTPVVMLTDPFESETLR